MNPAISPLVEAAVKRVLQALHEAYPDISTTGVSPPTPGVFIGQIAGEHVRLLPGQRFSRLFLMENGSRGRSTYFKHGFNLLKKGITPRWASSDDETRLVLWLTNAATELEAAAAQEVLRGAASAEDQQG